MFILSHGDLVAISKMNVALGTGGRVSWQSVEKWVRKTSIIAMFLPREEKEIGGGIGLKRTMLEIIAHINNS